MSFLNGLYQSTDIQLNGADSGNITNGQTEFYLISTLGENFVIYVDGTSVFVLNSSTGVLTISSPINITSTFSVGGVLTTPVFLKNTNNLACGVNSLLSLTTGTYNYGYGFNALISNTTGNSNVAIGLNTLYNNTIGGGNTAIGHTAGDANTTGYFNTFLGHFAGSAAGSSTYASLGCSLLGAYSKVLTAGVTNSTCIGYQSYINASNEISLGSGIENIIMRGNTDLTGGTATATTQATSDNSTLLATTAFVKNQGYSTLSSILSGTNTWTGVNTFNNNFVANCPITTGSILLKYDNNIMIEISKYALYSPISISPAFGQITFNYSPVFRTSFSLDNFITMSVGSAYGPATLLILNGSLEVGTASGIFKTNTIEPYQPVSNTTWYSTCANSTTLTFGNSATTNELSIQFAKTIFNRGLRFNGTDVLTGIVDTGTANQAITARKDFNGFDATIGNNYGCSLVSPVMRPKNFTLFQSVQNACHAMGANSAAALIYDATNTAVYSLGQDCLSAKTLNTKNVTSIGGSNMLYFTSEAFNFVTALGQGHLQIESGYNMTNVTMIGANTTFNNGGIKPTSVTNALFNEAANGIQLSASVAISNVFGIRTSQPITKSNQGIIGDSTEITLHSTGQKVIVTGGLNPQGFFQASIASPTLNWNSANFNMSAVTSFQMVYNLIGNATPTAITLPSVTASMVGQQFVFKKRGGLGACAYTITTTGGQPVFPIGGSLGTLTFPYTLLTASTQSSAQLMAVQSHFAGSGTGQASLGLPTLTINTWNGLPSTMITIGTSITLSGVTKKVSAFGTGVGGTGNYQMDSNYGSNIPNNPITSTDQFGYDILWVN